MSISVHSASINNFLSGYNCFFDALYNTDIYSVVGSSHKNFDTVYQFSSFATLPDYSDYKLLSNYEENQASQWVNEIHANDSEKNFTLEKMNINPPNTGSTSKAVVNHENNKTKSKIWRPFSPTPSSQECHIEDNIQNKNTRSCTRNTFFSIKPSNVKIGFSKTSVFKAVKKNSFACNQCSSRYLSNRQLNSHMRVHTRSKPFRCEYPNCFKSFARNEELTRHKRIHSGFKPHMCTICKKRFGRKDHLSKHLKTHLQASEKKVYQCPFSGCGHRYTRSDALTRHKSTAHAIKSQK